MEDYKHKNLFQTHDEEERKQLLADNCVRTEHIEVRREFDDEEMKEMENKHTELSIKVHDEDVKKKVFIDEYKAITKPLKEEKSILIKNLKDGFIAENEEVYCLDNQDEGVMEFYDVHGQCVMQRALFPHEKQTRIVPMTGTNDK